jgi:TPR repeat protein
MKKIAIIVVGLLILTACASTASQDKQDLAVAKGNFAVKNYELAYNHLLPLAQKGNKDAQYALGYLYYYGYGVTRDQKLAMEWINKAAAAGQPLAKEAKKQLQVSAENPFYAPT